MDIKKKILIVDDDTFLLDMYALKFSKSNFDVTIAIGAEDALKRIREGFSPDIILLDIMMPQIDGFDFMEIMNKEHLVPNAKRIILSNKGQSSDISRGQSLGSVGYIVKASSTPSEVIEKVNDIINNLN